MTAFFETPHAHWTPGLIGAMTWNVLVMSIGGMAIYNLMMDRYGAAKAASGFFIVPGASALIAWLLIDEHLKPLALIGLAAATLGVVLVWWKPRVPKRKTPGVAPGVEQSAAAKAYASERLPAACLPRSVTISKETFWPSLSVRMPALLDRADVDENVLRAVGRLDESEALLRVEELHGTCRHHCSCVVMRL